MNTNIKVAPLETNISEFIRIRWSTVAFSDQIPSDEELNILFTAASWSTSSMNEQPWRFLYGKRESLVFNELLGFLAPANKRWASNAGVLIAVIAESAFSNGSHNIHAWHDVGAAQACLLLQGAQMGIYGHQMGGFNREAAREYLSLPESMDIVCMYIQVYACVRTHAHIFMITQ